MMTTSLLTLSLLALTSWTTTEASFAGKKRGADSSSNNNNNKDGRPTKTKLLRFIGSDQELAAAQRLQEQAVAEQKKAGILKDAAMDQTMINADLIRQLVHDMKDTWRGQDTNQDTNERPLDGHCLIAHFGIGNCTHAEY